MFDSSHVRMKDIADKVGVSRSAVSYALNNKYDGVFLNEDTRKRIKDTAFKMGYIPNEIARSIKNGNMHIIGYFDNDLARHDYSGRILSGIMRNASLNEYNVKLYSCSKDGLEETIKTMLSHRVSGVILRGIQKDQISAFRKILHKFNIPFVMISYSDLPGNGIYVGSDEFNGCYMMIEHLYKQKHKKIALVTSNASISSSPRIDGFFKALKQFGLSISDELIKECDYKTSKKVVKELMSLSLDKRPTAVFCPTDTHAMYVLQALYDMNIRVPDVISVAGYGGLQSAPIASPPLTTINQDFDQIGMKACDLLIEDIKRPEKECFTRTRAYEIPSELVVRKSTGWCP